MIIYIVMLYVCDTLAHFDPGNIPNVGSVLFTFADLDKKRWSRSKIELLQARKSFQNVIPSMDLLDTINEEYIAQLLVYFKDSFETIKREVDNPVLRRKMNLALSDTLGGYLKVWVLPVTKYAYYGGTVSLESALKILQTYEDIKRSLKTDGRQWRYPNENLLNYVAINIAAPEYHYYSRSMRDSCDNLAYYEKTDKGLTIPLPFIDWNMLPSTMFLPLKNRPLTPLNSINSSKTFLKYYDVARNCMRTQNPDSLDEFDNKFQWWLMSDVVPHLNDNNFYIAFGSVLGLLNKSKNFRDKMLSSCNSKYNTLRYKASSYGLPYRFTSKKFVIIAIILIVEIAWCVPTLLYILFSNKKQKRSSRHCFAWFKRKYRNYYRVQSFIDEGTDSRCEIDMGRNSSRGVRLFVKSKGRKSDVQFSYDSKYTIKDKLSSRNQMDSLFSHEQFTHIDEVPLKLPVTKILPDFNNIPRSTYSQVEETGYYKTTAISRKHNKYSDARKSVAVQLPEARKTLTLIKDSEKTIQQITYSQVSIQSLNQRKVGCACTHHETENKECTIPNKIPCCPCLNCISNNENKTTTVTNKDSKPNLCLPCRDDKKQHRKLSILSNKKPKEVKKIPKPEPKTVKKIQKDNPKPTEKEHMLRIQIDRPKTEIEVGITTYREKKGSDQPSTTKKPSKIPRRTNINNLEKHKCDPIVLNNQVSKTTNVDAKNKSLDDTAIKNRTGKRNKKLNITL